MKDEVRKMVDVCHTEVQAAGGEHVRLRFFGSTSKSKRRVQFEVLFPWDDLPYFVPEIQRKWADERARRILKLNEVDNALPKPQ